MKINGKDMKTLLSRTSVRKPAHPATENAERTDTPAYKAPAKGDRLAAERRRNAPQVPTGTAPQPAPTSMEAKNATGVVPQARRTGSLTPKGRPTKPANSKSRERAYDPDLGKYPIPVVGTPCLMEKIADDDNIIAAAKVMLKEPDKATGLDRKTVPLVCKPLLEAPSKRETLQKWLLSVDGYRPGMVRTTYAPKPNGKLRKLGIANVRDRLVQRMILQAVEANLPDHAWSTSSFAYGHGQGIADAVKRADEIIADGAQYAVCVDLKAFFDNVPHHRLMRKLDEHIVDRRVVRLVRRFLTPRVLDKGTMAINRIGTPQGSVISPWLASMLYLDELDRELEHRGLPFVRYADDVTVFCRSRAAANRIRNRIIRYIEEVMECPVNQDKTKVVPVASLSILGLYRSGRFWKIQREKERAVRAITRSLLRQYAESGDLWYRGEAESKFKGWLQYYRHIPNLKSTKIPALERWFERLRNNADIACGGGREPTPFD